MRIEDWLLERNILTPDQVESARQATIDGIRFDQAVVELGFLEEDQMLRHAGEAFGIEYVDLNDRDIDPNLLELAPRALFFRHQVLPIEQNNGTLRVVTSDPFDLDSLDELHVKTGLHIEPVLAPHPEIETAMKRHFGVGGETVGALIDEKGELEIVDDDGAGENYDELAQEASVVRLVNEILMEAIKLRTSDIHIEPREKGIRIRYRIDGVLQNQALPPEIHRFAPAIVSRLKIMAKLNISEKRLPQDGRIQLRGQGRDIDIRVSIIPMAHGEGVVLRVLDKQALNFSLEGLGMESDHYQIWSNLIKLPHGILLVTGPTGSGKTTTLYSALQEIANDSIKVITVEDPVEYEFDRIQQIQVHPKIGLTFAAGLRSILRHDPDVVLIGEIRDLETGEIATQAALTGHLVLSTLHTNDAAGAFTRLTDMGVEPFLVASTVEAVMAQRLVRMICSNCIQKHEVDVNTLPLDFPKLENEKTLELSVGSGCIKCHHTGFRGRQGIFELLPISEKIRSMTVHRASSAEIKSQALKDGLRTLRRDAWSKLRLGKTTLEEVLRVTKSDEDLKLIAS